MRPSDYPGLIVRSRKSGAALYWSADSLSRKAAGFPDRLVRLPSHADEAELKRRCEELRDRLMHSLLIRGRISKRRVPGLVYFLRQGETIKIGFTRRISRRLRNLQTGSAERLQLLGTIPASQTAERRLHQQFAELRLEGEWFRAEEPLLRTISALISARTKEKRLRPNGRTKANFFSAEIDA